MELLRPVRAGARAVRSPARCAVARWSGRQGGLAERRKEDDDARQYGGKARAGDWAHGGAARDAGAGYGGGGAGSGEGGREEGVQDLLAL